MDVLIKEQEQLDRQVYDYSLSLLKPFYTKRREFIAATPRFWPSVLETSELLSPYILYEDSLVFDSLREIWIEWDTENSRNVTIEFEFGDNPYFNAQRLRKKLIWNSDEEYYYSLKPTPIEWKSESLLDLHKRGGEESFFTWFDYTTTDNKEDRDENSEIARVICDEIYPPALELYKQSLEDDDIQEEYDISE